MSKQLTEAFPQACFIPFNPKWRERLAEAKKRSEVDTIIVESTIPDWAIIPPNWLLREHWIVENSIPTILEVGCQRGHVFRDQGYQQLDRWFGMDIDVWKTPNITQGDLHRPPYKWKSFDTVVCAEVLEHVDDPQLALMNTFRLAKQRVIVTVPHEHVWGPQALPFMRLEDKDKMDGLTRRQQIDKNSRWLPDCLNPKDYVADWDEEKYEHLWHKRHFYHSNDVEKVPSGRTAKPEIDFVEFMEETCKIFDEESGEKSLENLHIEKIEYYPWGFLGAVICLDGSPFMSRLEFKKVFEGDDDFYGQVFSGENNVLVGFLRRV